MKYILAAILLVVTTFSLKAVEEETIFGSSNHEFGGFGAPVAKFSTIDGNVAYISGGRGGLIIDHNFIIGAGFYNHSINSVKSDSIDPVLRKSPRLATNYFGLELEYVYEPSKLLHFSFMSLLGAGWTGFETAEQREINGENYRPDYGHDWFYVAAPQVNAEVNLFTWMRLSAGVGYRFTFGADYSFRGSNFDDKKLSGAEGTITIKFGKF